MDGLFSSIETKVFSECGLIALLLMMAVVWLTLQLAKTRSEWEADRTEAAKLRELDRLSVLKLLENKNELEFKLGEAIARIEVLILAVRARAGEDD